MSEPKSTKLDQRLAWVCLNCPVCRQARAQKQGVAFGIVKSVERRICPFCRAYERVYHRQAHES